jgi:hypothetical protein
LFDILLVLNGPTFETLEKDNQHWNLDYHYFVPGVTLLVSWSEILGRQTYGEKMSSVYANMFAAFPIAHNLLAAWKGNYARAPQQSTDHVSILVYFAFH